MGIAELGVVRDARGNHIDPLAKVHPSVSFGEETVVWAFASIHHGVVLGSFVSVGEHTYIGFNATIGARTRMGQGCYVVDRMTIGERVFLGPHCVFTNDRYPRANHPNPKHEHPIVEDDVVVGANATILPGVRLGHGCIVGAGAVVVEDVAPYTMVVGNPAKEVKRCPANQIS